jgi:biotin-dependent carboxylase-like uncharacterized protein
MSILVLSPGLLSSVQDRGRFGYRHLGIGCSGAVDGYSYSVANLLVGNPMQTVAVEITLTGPRLRFDRAARIAICGASIEASVDGQALPGWHRIDLPANCELVLGACRRGTRAYLAVAGGFDVEACLGSTSTDLRAGIGGIDGRALIKGDRLRLTDGFRADCDRLVIERRWADPADDLDFATPAIVHLLPGQDQPGDAEALFAHAWRVGVASNRQGLRLQGTRLAISDQRERVSEPVMPGTVQLPPDGQPIVLLADAQTHGGYPRIGHVIAADLHRLAQLRPNDSLRFVACTPAEARHRRIAQRQRLARMSIAMADSV